MESVGVAIAEDQIDVIAKWISNDSVSFRKKITNYYGPSLKFCWVCITIFLNLKIFVSQIKFEHVHIKYMYMYTIQFDSVLFKFVPVRGFGSIFCC